MIKPNASPDEESSPFYLENKRICEFWETFITNKGGKIEGKYNAWSLILKGEFETQYKWKVKIKKSTFSNESIFIPAEKSIFRQIEFTTLGVDLGLNNFRVRKCNYWMDLFRRITRSSLEPTYVLRGEVTTEVMKLIQNKVKIEGLEYIEYSAKTKELKVDVRELITNDETIEKIITY